MTQPTPADRNYPITPAPEDDPRFSFGFLTDVAAVLDRHGFPRPTGRDLVELQQALFRFLYRDPN